MGLLENLVVNAKQAANAVGKKTGELVDTSKLKLQSVDLSGDIRKNYEALGRAIYEAQKLGIDSTDEIEDIIILINEKYDELDEVNEQLSKMSSKVFCMKCGGPNPKSASFCSQCGDKLVHDVQQDETASGHGCNCGCNADDSDQQEPENQDQEPQTEEPKQEQE